MHRAQLPKILIFLLMSAALAAVGQTKPAGEVDVAKSWTYPTSDAAGEILAADGGHIFLGSEGAKVEALSLDGKKLWSADLGGEIRSNILPLESNLVLVTATAAAGDAAKPADNILRSLSKETGITTWTLKLANAERYFLNSANGAVVIVSKGGVIQSLDVKGGTLKWKREIAEKFTAEPVFNKGDVTLATASGQVFVVSLATGEIESIRKMTAAVTALGRTADGGLIVGDERGRVSLFVNSSDKPYWKFKSGGEISQAVGAGGNVMAVSHDNFVYLLAGRNGGVIWKKRMPGRVSNSAIFADKYVLLSGFEEHGALILDLSNGKVAGQIAFGDGETVRSIQTSATAIFVLTDTAAYAFSLNGVSSQTKKTTAATNPRGTVDRHLK